MPAAKPKKKPVSEKASEKKSAEKAIEKSAAQAPKLTDHAIRQKIVEARTKLLFLYPFLGYLVSNLDDRIGEEWLKTAATDGTSVYWSPEFVSSLSAGDTMFVLAHEAIHCALQHLWRRGGRDPRRWNLAADACGNDMLLEAGLTVTIPHIRGAKGRCVEEVYEDIDALIKQNGGNGDSDGGLDDHGLWHDGKPGDRAAADSWRAALANARQFGKIPAGLARHVDAVLNPKRDWRSLLREGLFYPEDYSWVPTDRRFPTIMLPTLRGEIHRVVVAIDTSGSICGDQLASFWTELTGILRDNRCEARVMACDAAIQNEWSEHEFDVHRVKKDVRGGGGTSFVPVFERVEKYVAEGWRPEAVVYLTDLDGEFPKNHPELRTIWIVGKEDGQKRVPFGEVIALD